RSASEPIVVKACAATSAPFVTTPLDPTMRRTLVLSIALALAATATAQEAATVAAEAIPAQSLDRALNALSRQTGLQFVYDAQAAGNPATRAVPAGLPAEEALRRLLAGTGLRHRYLNAATVTIEAEAAPAAAPATGQPATPPAAGAG